MCEDGGDLICCSNCPRSYHQSCIAGSITTLPPNWSCERCHEDSVVLPKEELPMNVSSADIQSAYGSLVCSEGFVRCCVLLTKLSLIVEALKEADHGKLLWPRYRLRDHHRTNIWRFFVLQGISLPIRLILVLCPITLKQFEPRWTIAQLLTS